MNQENKEFELSGTLGNLNDAALTNLTSQNTTETTNNVVQELPKDDSVNNNNNNIEMLDVPTAPVEPSNNQNADMQASIQPEQLNPTGADANVDNNINVLDLEPIQPMSTQPNLNPTPTNFDIGDIGSVPPVDPTGKNDKKKRKKNNVLFIILVIIFILAIGALLFYYLRISKGSMSNAIEPKNLNYELGTELPTDINEYATFKSISSSNCILDTKNVDINNAGTYEYTITCGNKSYTGNITLKDSKAPEVKTKTIVKKVNDTITPKEFIEECNETSECTYEFENAEGVQNNILQAGTYDINIIIKDANGNSTTSPVKLIIIDSDIKVYLNCILSDQTVEGFNGTVSYADKIGISPESQYVGIYFRIKEYMASTEEEYNNIKSNYTDNGTLVINNGDGVPIFDDTNLTISFEEILSGTADFGADYSAIKTYYETTQNYKCNILNVN